MAVQRVEAIESTVCCEDLSVVGDREPELLAGGCWTLELADAVGGARDGRYAFFLVVEGERVDLVADARGDGEAFLRPARGATPVAGDLALPRLGSPDRAYARPVSAR